MCQSYDLAATRTVRWRSHRNSFEMKLMGCLCSSFINYRLLSLREIEINSGLCVTDLVGLHLLTVASVGGVKYFNPAFSRHLHVSSRSSRKEICSLRESILSSCWREWDSRLMGSAPTSSGADGMRLWKGASTNWSFCREKESRERVLPSQEDHPVGQSMLPAGVHPTGAACQPACGALVAFKGPLGWKSCCVGAAGSMEHSWDCCGVRPA